MQKLLPLPIAHFLEIRLKYTCAYCLALVDRTVKIEPETVNGRLMFARVPARRRRALEFTCIRCKAKIAMYPGEIRMYDNAP